MTDNARTNRHQPGVRVKVLVFRTGSLGDTVCAIPAFRLIREHFPDTDLSLLCDKGVGGGMQARDVIEPLRIFDRIETYPARRGLRTTMSLLRAALRLRSDVVLVLPQDAEPMESVERKRKFFGRLGVRDVRAKQFCLPPGEARPNEAERLIRILNSIGIGGPKPGYDIPHDPAAADRVRQTTAATGVDSDRPIILFCGGGKSAVQHWALDRYAAVLSRLVADLRVNVLAVGSPADLERYRDAGIDRVEGVKLLQALTGVQELFEVCANAIGYFGNDTGPAHICAAVGTPAAVVMSGRAPRGSWDPDVEPRLVLRSEEPCGGCALKTDVAELHRCMSELSITRVAGEVIPFFNQILSVTAG